MSGPVAVGIDAGSTTCKLVAVDADGVYVTGRTWPSGFR